MIKTNLMVGISLVGLQLAHAQIDSLSNSQLPQTRAQGTYFEQVTYLTANHDRYTLRTFLTDSTLYRLDTYQLVDRTNPYTNPPTLQKVAIHQGVTKIMYPTGQVYLSCDYEYGFLNGPLLVYYADGSLKRRELYSNGLARESHCYTSSGSEQPCQPLYQRVQFTAKPAQLQRYLEKNLASIAEELQVQAITIRLTINELGQISKTEVEARPEPASAKLTAVVLDVIRSMPQWHTDHTNWQAAQMDGVPIVDQLAIYISRKRGFLYVYLPKP
jgi:hypothetical protein